MFDPADFSTDTEFRKLLQRSEAVDLTTAALELARDAYPGLDFDETHRWIQDRAEELSSPIARTKSDREALHLLSECIAEKHGIFGDQAAYQSADSSFLPQVIETKRGLPISLSVLYMAVASRIGLDLVGIGAPMHFLTCCDSAEGLLYVDAFHRGRILTESECLDWLSELTGQPHNLLQSSLKPVRPRQIITRMLNNLKALYLNGDDWESAWWVQRRLTALQPADYAQRRDLGIIGTKANHPVEALKMIESCLKTCPEDERESLTAVREEALQKLSKWN